MTQLPQLPSVDVAVIGGGTAAMAAALELKQSGLDVIVIGGRSYLGEDICDSLRLFLPPDMKLDTPLAQRLYGPAVEAGTAVRPMQVKLELERALREAGIPYLLCTLPGEVLVDDQGAVTAVTLCNRSGRQVLPCRAIVDGTVRGEVARLAGAPLSAPGERVEVIRRVIGGEDVPGGEGEWVAEGRLTYPSVKPQAEWQWEEIETEETLWVYRTTETLEDGSWAAWMALEQRVRNACYRPGQHLAADGVFVRTGERLFPDSDPQQLSADYSELELAQISVCNGSLFVTGDIANVATDEASDILRHDNAIRWGMRIGGLIAANLPEAKPLGLGNPYGTVVPAGTEPREANDDLRWEARCELPADFDQHVAAIEEVDVLVVGGGTGGAPAGISAARAGANTLVVEHCAGLGGIGTVGLIGAYYFGHRVGFTAEMDAEVRAKSPMEVPENSWDVEAKMQWYHEQLSQAGGRVWYKSMACGALVEGNKVVGAIIATPQGRIAVRATCVVDATGSADVAAAAGAGTERIGAKHVASQGTGLGARNPGVPYDNTDYDFIDVNDVQDTTSAFSAGREKFADAFDLQQIVDSRERRHIVGDVVITPMDILLERVFPDTINKAYSNFDTHGFTVHPFFMLVPPDHDARLACVPLRALLPRGLDGILVTGLGISADRDAMPVLRMQACVQNQGFAAGLAAAMCENGNLRELDIRALQRRLIAEGVLEEGMDTAVDTFPLDDARIDKAIAEAAHDFAHLAKAFTLPADELRGRLSKAYGEADDADARLRYAHVLGILGDETGVETLRQHVQVSEWDEGWDYTGMGQFGRSMSELDSCIIALGRCGGDASVDVLIAKAESLPEQAEFSHYRALSEALAAAGDARAIPALEALLNRPDIAGHEQADVTSRIGDLTDVRQETRVRNRSLIELHLARALVQLAPEHAAGAAILQRYARDQRATFARHAKAILDERMKHVQHHSDPPRM